MVCIRQATLEELRALRDETRRRNRLLLRFNGALLRPDGSDLFGSPSGDGSGSVLDCLEEALVKHPARDHRFTIQHGQLATAAQLQPGERLISATICGYFARSRPCQNEVPRL